MANVINRRYRPSHALVLIAFFIIALGVFLRAWHYVLDYSMWVDEAMLALNIIHRSIIGLMHPLDYDQGAPLGFLFLEKIAVLTFGNTDYTLRLIPFLSGICSLFLFYKAIKKYIGLRATLIALGLFAFSSRLIFYSWNLKQYSSDAMISIVLLLVAYNCIREQATSRDFTLLGVVGSLALWFSHPALFVITGIGGTLALDSIFRRDNRRYLWLGVIFLFWLLSFGAIYLISLRFLAANKVLINFWLGAYMPMPPWRDPAWLSSRFLLLVNYSVGSNARFVMKTGEALLSLGFFSLLIRKWQFALIPALTFTAMLLASGFEKYPVDDRLLLFILPLTIFLISEGADRCYLTLRKVNSPLAVGAYAILVVLFLWAPMRGSYDNVKHPSSFEEIKPILSYLTRHRKNSDLIYVYYGALPAFRYYAPFYGIKKNDYIAGIYSRHRPEEYIKDIDKLKGNEREAWFLFCHNFSWDNSVDEFTYFNEHLKEIGRGIDGIKSRGCRLYLYDLTHPAMGKAIRPALTYLAEHKKDTDLVYVYYGALRAFKYYAPMYGIGNNYIVGIQSREHPEAYLKDMDRLKGQKRVWFVFFHDYARNRHTASEQTYFLRHLNKIGTLKEKFGTSHSAVYLFDLEKDNE